jgi:lipopolysaccharide biosynthesis regulator YciM
VGWRRAHRHRNCFGVGALPQSLGLNFPLNEQQDQAIEAFIEVVKVDPQTVELHFALGSLFRRRGEVDRAIRMHLNLVERADLAEDRKQQALFELAQDYLKAGILDRAEACSANWKKPGMPSLHWNFCWVVSERA